LFSFRAVCQRCSGVLGKLFISSSLRVCLEWSSQIPRPVLYLCYCFLAVIGTIVILCLLFLEILRSCFCYFKSRHVFVERSGMKCHIFFPASFNMSVYSLSNKLISLGIVMLSVSLNWSAYWIFTVF
jgi:hypothetical protein